MASNCCWVIDGGSRVKKIIEDVVVETSPVLSTNIISMSAIDFDGQHRKNRLQIDGILKALPKRTVIDNGSR